MKDQFYEKQFPMMKCTDHPTERLIMECPNCHEKFCQTCLSERLVHNYKKDLGKELDNIQTALENYETLAIDIEDMNFTELCISSLNSYSQKLNKEISSNLALLITDFQQFSLNNLINSKMQAYQKIKEKLRKVRKIQKSLNIIHLNFQNRSRLLNLRKLNLLESLKRMEKSREKQDVSAIVNKKIKYQKQPIIVSKYSEVAQRLEHKLHFGEWLYKKYSIFNPPETSPYSQLIYTFTNNEFIEYNLKEKRLKQISLQENEIYLPNYFSTCQCKDYIYVTGGFKNNSFIKNCLLFDTNYIKMRKRKKMLESKAHHALIQIQDKLCSVGGLNKTGELKICELYDPQNNKWNDFPNLSFAKMDPGVCTFQDLIIFSFGGVISSNVANVIEKIDTRKLDGWSQLLPFKNDGFTPRTKIGCIEDDNNCILIFGGESKRRKAFSECFCFDVYENKISKISKLKKTAIFNFYTPVKAFNYLCAISGWNDINSEGNDLHIFSLSLKKWSIIPLNSEFSNVKLSKKEILKKNKCNS